MGTKIKKFLFRYAVNLLYIGLIVYTASIVDSLLFQYRFTTWVLYKSVDTKDYIVPTGYNVVYSKDEGMYAVSEGDDRYLGEGNTGTRTYYLSVCKPTLMFDSCIAKAYLKAYLKNNEPKVKF